jgi:formyltetrahydrofolate-dependent phosphoribosylglycinamide formyltransferase
MSPGARTSLEPLIGAPMPIGEFLPLAIRLAAALSELHGRGTIHGGLEPTSILRDPVTGDIALANPERTAGGAAWTEPSLPYTSPERTGLLGRPIDSRSDLYSLGVVLYALLAGRLPFEARDAIEWVHCHVARQPRPLDAIRPSLPRPLVDIVDKLLAKLPDDRYQSAQGLRHDLERCLGLWRELGALAPFPLGERDVSEELLIPQQLYGRDAERAALREAFERVAGSGTPELVLVSGPAGIGKPAVVVDHRAHAGDRRAFGGELVRVLGAHRAEAVVLAGFMRVLTATFLDQFPDRVVNVHPALLPAFPGIDGPAQAFAYGVKVAGCTVHLVDATVDGGAVIAQAAVPVREDDTVETLRARILAEELLLLPRAVQLLAAGRLQREGRRVRISG